MIEKSIFKKALLDSVLSKIYEIENSDLPYVDTDEGYDNRIFDLIKGRNMASGISFRNRLKIGIIAAILICLTMIMSITAIRSNSVKLLTNAHKDYFEIIVTSDSNTFPTNIEKIYIPSYMPESYELKAITKRELFTQVIWSNNSYNIRLQQTIVSKNTNIHFDTEHSKLEYAVLGGYELYCVIAEGNRYVSWITEEYSFLLVCPSDIEFSEIEKIIESMESQEG